MSTFFSLLTKDAKGNPLSMSTFQGKVVLVVNVASKCGFTPQYAELQALYKKYSDQGLVVLGAPCNQFGGQEPGDEDAIVQFCSRNYGVEFPILEKMEVNGDATSPLYEWLKAQKSSLGLARIKWVIERFVSTSGGAVLEPYVQKALAEPTPA